MPSDYFPERHLASWFRERGEDVSFYCFERTGCIPLTEAYRALVDDLNLDAIVLVDGGTDSLMKGDEAGLGTPHEDIASIAAVDQLEVGTKLLVCLGFGVDAYHGVCHAQFLEGVAEIIKAGGFLGAFSLLREMEEARLYAEASLYVFQRMPEHTSIVTSSILTAVGGEFGDYHATNRTRGSKLWISPLMSLYWCFRLEPVARRVQYLDAMKLTNSYRDVHEMLERREAIIRHRLWDGIPI
jgi:hypothetical protein